MNLQWVFMMNFFLFSYHFASTLLFVWLNLLLFFEEITLKYKKKKMKRKKVESFYAKITINQLNDFRNDMA